MYKYGYINEDHRERSSHIFIHNKLYFCKAEEFNDPFDCAFKVQFSSDKGKNRKFADMALQLRYPDLSSDKRAEILRREEDAFDGPDFDVDVQAAMQQTLNTWGICCFSEVPNSLLMWAHYANKHHGFCLKFSTENFYVALPPNLVIPHQVHYTDQYPIAWIAEDVAIEATLLTKAEQWKYEKEWRIITPDKIGCYPFPASCLTGVIFGCRMSEEHKKLIRDWCKDRQPAIKYYEAKQSEDSYSLNIVEIS